jgi:hypothetical protein
MSVSRSLVLFLMGVPSPSESDDSEDDITVQDKVDRGNIRNMDLFALCSASEFLVPNHGPGDGLVYSIKREDSSVEDSIKIYVDMVSVQFDLCAVCFVLSFVWFVLCSACLVIGAA